MRLIDADALLTDRRMRMYYHLPNGDTAIPIIDIEHAPTIEERKTGEWIPFDIPWYQCSECGAVRENESFMENFCPYCGADMRGGQDG